MVYLLPKFNKHPYLQFISSTLLMITIAGVSSAQTPRALPSAYSGNALINYVRTWDLVKPVTNPGDLTVNTGVQVARMTTQYLDGLGRPVQVVVKQGSLVTGGTATDLIKVMEYDELGRERFNYLATPAGNSGGNASINDGLFKLNPFQQQQAFYNSYLSGQVNEVSSAKNWAYGQSDFENSVLNRPSEIFAAGVNWVGTQSEALEIDRHSNKMKYWVNKVADSVRIWTVADGSIGSFGSYSSPGNPWYPAGELTKNVKVDEHGKQIIEFKDKRGLVILQKIQMSAASDDGNGKGHHGWLCTYNIYDLTGRLRCVVQPRGVELLRANSWSMTALSNAILNEQCFRFEYDERGRMIVKKSPGAEETFMVYDARDRVVLLQDANMRAGSPVKWMYTKYDGQNRPQSTGLINSNSGWSTHAAAAASSTNYPNLGGFTYEELSYTFYDNYDWLSTNGNPFSATRYTADDGLLLTPSNSNYPYPQATAQSNATTGLVTGTKIKVLGTNTYHYSITYYDNKGRAIQVQTQNIAGGVIISTNQYGFAGQLLINYELISNNISGGIPAVGTLTKYTTDTLGRVLAISKEVFTPYGIGNTGEVTIVENEYDALGQLKKKVLAPSTGPGAGPLDSLTYDYNIRGWLLGVNRLYAKDEHNDNYFGFDLGYDKAQNGIIGNLSYTTPRFNGNINGTVWKSKGDGEKRKYDFTYDAANRILSADFNQHTSSAFNKSAGIDFSMSALSYDVNGNILGVKHRGWAGTSSATIDSLTYNYVSYSNKLLNVIDGVNNADTKLGDFRTSDLHPGSGSKNSSTQDYVYDDNGNLVRDLNKDIETYDNENGIEYNHLNLPTKVTLKKGVTENKGYVEYTYDAAGNKLKKVVYEFGVDTTVTLYVGKAVYENDSIQFLAHEEGRIRYSQASPGKPAAFHFDYMLRDHLGNVRATLTTQKDTAFYPPATLETASLTTERLLYGGVDTGRVATSGYVNYPTNGWFGGASAYFQKLNGNGPAVGSNMVLKVMAGDKVSLYVNYWYEAIPRPGPGTPVNPFNSVLNALLSGVGGISSGHNGVTSDILEAENVLDPAVTSFLGTQSGYVNTLPKAFLNWVFLDEQFNIVASNSGFEQVAAIDPWSGGVGAKIMLNNHQILKNGYLYVYISNESPNVDVFFDNLMVTHIRGPILEENHYYPLGLTMAGISSKALAFGEPANKLKFNGKEEQRKEFSDGVGIDWMDFGARMYDNQLGRWMTIDPLASKKPWQSVFNFSSNNPLSNVDPNGLTDYTINKKTGEVTQIGEANDDPDRVLKSDKDGNAKYKKNGKAKVAFGGIEKGILKDGMNFKTENNLISVGGDGQPSVSGVEYFAFKFSEYLGLEVAGSYISKDGASSITHMTIGNYENNTFTSTASFGHTLTYIVDPATNPEEYDSYKVKGFFHTHPDSKSESKLRPSELDRSVRDASLKLDPSVYFKILTYPVKAGDSYPYKFDYTTGYND